MKEECIVLKEITESDIKDICDLDLKAFKRNMPRSEHNIKALLWNNPRGNVIAYLNGIPVGFGFSHIMGSRAYIGPFAVLEQFRKKGIGQLILRELISKLNDQKIDVIGLEVLPDNYPALNLYFKNGFIPGSVTYGFSPIYASKFSLDSCERIINGYEVDEKLLNHFCTKMEDNEDGFSLAVDIRWMLKFDPANILFFVTDNLINGFLAYSTNLSPHVWGYILHDKKKAEKIYKTLFLTLQRLHKETELVVRVNSEAPVALNILKSFRISKVLIRMIAAEDFKISSRNCIFKSWVG
ncbi:MAG TPA: GNAT family N-acetyltransferase [Firmicutes bacterium]|nr:GNAT family N-acetyltransferase [Bacillota bacterium]